MMRRMHQNLRLFAFLFFYLTAAAAAPKSSKKAPAKQPVAVHKGTMVLEQNNMRANGKAEYTIESSGRLLIKGYAEAPLIHKPAYKFDETYNVEPKNLLSEEYEKLGNVIPFDKLLLKITAVDPERQLSTAEGKNDKGKVLFIVDTSRKMIDLHRVSMTSRFIPVPLRLKRAG